ncbi:trypsin-like peptidase domain-containing protein [Spongiimicrobium sp. 2-473A-2-J]|uniref:trypsin-like peptidase domain-containing protein n=1 Tax=Eudoraea algarum TaxID=3417568 RepID=UPI003D36A632
MSPITSNIISRVFQVGFEEDYGTGFTIESMESQYLVSARHVFEPNYDKNELILKNGQTLNIDLFHEESWVNLEVICNLSENENMDIVVFTLPADISGRTELPIVKQYFYGEDGYFLGFPYTKNMLDDTKLNNGYPFPFVKKCICSSLPLKTSEGLMFFLDGHINPGFSGGPVVFIRDNGQIALGGVATGYVKHPGLVEYEYVEDNGKLEKEELEYLENSGIIEALSVMEIFKIIDKVQKNDLH